MSTEKTITIPAGLHGAYRLWTSPDLRTYSDELSRDGKFVAAAALLRYLADEIERQHPPRMDEPDEFGAMVEASTKVKGDEIRARRRLARFKTVGEFQWSDELGRTYRWDELIDPKPVQS